MKRILPLWIILLMWVPLDGHLLAQAAEYQEAERLIREHRQEEALPILQALYEQDPAFRLYLNRLIDTLLYLRRLEDALEILDRQIAREGEKGSDRTRLRKAEILMQSGEFSRSLDEYLLLLRDFPDRFGDVQQRLVQLRDPQLYRIAIERMEHHLKDLESDHPSWLPVQQLRIWMLMESRQFEEAVAAAREAEEESDVTVWTLYSIAGQLLSNRHFELAAEAFSYYSDAVNRKLRSQAQEQLARTWYLWAEHLDEYNLENLRLREELYRKSHELYRHLLEEDPEYEGRIGILLQLAESALDRFRNRQEASAWTARIEELSGEEGSPQLDYLRGRLHLHDSSWSEARQAFTRAAKTAAGSPLAERARYHVALTDFLSGDFEYALLQLRQLERENSSFWANDALRLRMWIQEGIRADTSGGLLREFATLLETLRDGKYRQAWIILLEMGGTAGASSAPRFTAGTPTTPLFDDALLQLLPAGTSADAPLLYSLLVQVNRTRKDSPLRERLLWEEATLAYRLVESGISEWAGWNRAQGESRFAAGPVEMIPAERELLEQTTLPSSLKEVADAFEQLLVEFPGGFYAPYAREKLRELSGPDT